MNAFFVRRALSIIPVLLLVALITFVIMHATPGGPWDTDATRRSADPKLQQALNHRYGLDKPLFLNVAKYETVRGEGGGFLKAAWGLADAQFENYLWNVVRGDLGPSYRLLGRDVQDVMFTPDEGRPFWTSRFGTTALIGGLAIILSMLVGIPLGTIAALKRNTIIDYLSLFFATVMYGIPSFVLGVFFILIFAVALSLMPVIPPAIWNETSNTPNLVAVVLPALTLAIPSAAYLARLTRSSLLEVMRMDCIRTARAKGLSQRTVVLRHIMRNALIPVATVLGPTLAAMVTGSFIIESLFSVNGIGRLFVESITRRDYSMIMGTVLFYALLVAVANLVVDFTYGLLDPRVRVGR